MAVTPPSNVARARRCGRHAGTIVRCSRAGAPAMFFRTTCALALLLTACSGSARAQTAETDAVLFQNDLREVLECSAGPDLQQRVVSRLRAARYTDVAERTAELRDWRFEEKGADDDHRMTVITLPQPMTVHGIDARQVVADPFGFSIALDGAQRERVIAAYGLHLQSSTLREPFELWSAPTASVIVRSAGDGHRLGCKPFTKDGKATVRQVPAVDVQDLQDAIHCRADEGSMRRLQAFWQRLSEQPQFEWPQDVRSVNEVNYTVDDEELHLLLIGLQAPVQAYGVPTHTIALAFGGFFGVDLGSTAVAPVLAKAGMDTSHAVGKDAWQRLLPPVAFSGGSWIPQHIVMRTDEGRVVAGCASDYERGPSR
ncbi:hypothetical protein FEO92_18840 [Stenotrophomonas maltophilia]|uniref:hypothetical protein n=1 Tax=Stenotrophomonas maltophilia TaxID=40324 RepID=UPI0012B15EF7|nr:hypothetical protein [Stenotrophomonas maltophilia]MCU1145225.1 hypothetical protein [Stenotrophomonas maltophilia]QGL94327.1 hypothetical protein FEO92_18840 [Stenotrophomonas maltophilia]